MRSYSIELGRTPESTQQHGQVNFLANEMRAEAMLLPFESNPENEHTVQTFASYHGDPQLLMDCPSVLVPT